MSPHLRNLLEDAADDGGRPVHFDLGAVRAAGRRTIWRRRALTIGGGVGAAAVITSVALVLSSGGSNGFQPANPGAPTGSAPSWEDVLRPVLFALETKGFVVATGYSHSVSMASDSSSDSPGLSLNASTVQLTDVGSTGAVTAAEFTDVSAVQDFVLGDVDPGPLGSEVDGYGYTEQCAVVPVNIHRSDFAWDSCEESSNGRQRVSSGGDPFSEALGVTLLREDGSGVSIAISTGEYDRPVGGGAPTAPTLDQLPLTTDELLAAAEQMLEIGPSGEPDDTGVATASPTAVPTASASVPGADSCGDEVPVADECESVESVDIEAGPLLDYLASAGINAEDVGSTGGGDSDGELAQSIRFRLTDSEGRSGTASIGIATTFEAAPLMNDTSIAWCAVAPNDLARDFEWHMADDPATSCADTFFEWENPLLVMHTEPGADAIGVTLIRADHSVISVSVSQEPYSAPGISGDPLSEVPLDRDTMLTLIGHLSDANPMS